MSARSRAFPWWGARKIPPPARPAPPVEFVPISASDNTWHIYFTETGPWSMDTLRHVGQDEAGREVFEHVQARGVGDHTTSSSSERGPLE